MRKLKIKDSKSKADLGQFFLEDQKNLQKIVDLAAIQPGEVVLEIGAGDGRLTNLLAKKAKKVIAIEIDKKFEPDLKNLPNNVEVVIGDALEYLPALAGHPERSRRINKILGNLPSTLVEPIFPKLTKIDFQLAIFLVPEKFAFKLMDHPVLNAYFGIKLIEKVSKKSFSPIPRTNWEIISVEKIPDQLKSGKMNLFLTRFVYEHPNAKLKNSLMEGMIKFYAAKGKKLTKNEARKIVKSFILSRKILENLPDKDFPWQNLTKLKYEQESN